MDTTRLTESARLFSGLGTSARLQDGRSITIRVASAGDAGAVTAMHTRCSPHTVLQRYHSMPRMTGRLLSQLLNTDVALIAEAPNRSVVAMGNLGRDLDDSGELAVLVEDGWQSRGLGTVLLQHLVTMARLVGFREVHAVCLPTDRWCRRAMGRIAAPTVERSAGQVTLRLNLGRADTRLPEQLPMPEQLPLSPQLPISA